MATAVKPRIKLDKKEARKGDLVEVKALVQHVMENGQRKDADGKTIPRKILNKFVCTVAGKQVFAADFETAISANPYIQFKFKAEEGITKVREVVIHVGKYGEQTPVLTLEPVQLCQTTVQHVSMHNAAQMKQQ